MVIQLTEKPWHCELGTLIGCGTVVRNYSGVWRAQHPEWMCIVQSHRTFGSAVFAVYIITYMKLRKCGQFQATDWTAPHVRRILFQTCKAPQLWRIPNHRLKSSANMKNPKPCKMPLIIALHIVIKWCGWFNCFSDTVKCHLRGQVIPFKVDTVEVFLKHVHYPNVVCVCMYRWHFITQFTHSICVFHMIRKTNINYFPGPY